LAAARTSPLGGALGFKAPTLAELFQNFPSFNFFANPNLKPETSIGFDLGFDNGGFLAAARTLACERGPAAVTIDSVTQRLRAPKGSFYYRFASRDALLGELWLATVLAYQEGFVAAIEAGDGLAAALHTPAWARQHLDDACFLLLYSRHDFVQGDWPAPLKRGVRDQASRFEACLKNFARHAFGRVGLTQTRCATVLAEVPIAAVKTHLQQRKPPPRAGR
jgi:AcrR family transcriptional regulator